MTREAAGGTGRSAGSSIPPLSPSLRRVNSAWQLSGVSLVFLNTADTSSVPRPAGTSARLSVAYPRFRLPNSSPDSSLSPPYRHPASSQPRRAQRLGARAPQDALVAGRRLLSRRALFGRLRRLPRQQDVLPLPGRRLPRVPQCASPSGSSLAARPDGQSIDSAWGKTMVGSEGATGALATCSGGAHPADSLADALCPATFHRTASASPSAVPSASATLSSAGSTRPTSSRARRRSTTRALGARRTATTKTGGNALLGWADGQGLGGPSTERLGGGERAVALCVHRPLTQSVARGYWTENGDWDG